LSPAGGWPELRLAREGGGGAADPANVAGRVWC
jgi:hypothetical protein